MGHRETDGAGRRTNHSRSCPPHRAALSQSSRKTRGALAQDRPRSRTAVATASSPRNPGPIAFEESDSGGCWAMRGSLGDGRNRDVDVRARVRSFSYHTGIRPRRRMGGGGAKDFSSERLGGGILGSHNPPRRNGGNSGSGDNDGEIGSQQLAINPVANQKPT